MAKAYSSDLSLLVRGFLRGVGLSDSDIDRANAIVIETNDVGRRVLVMRYGPGDEQRIELPMVAQ